MSFRVGAAGTSGTSPANNVTVSLAGAVAGDAAVLMVGFNFTTPTATTPSGWTLLSGPSDFGTGSRTYFYSKILTSGDITTGSVTVSLSTTSRVTAAVGIVSSPTASPFGTISIANTNTTTVPTISTTGTNSVVLEFAFDTIASGTPVTLAFPNGTTDAQGTTANATGTNTASAVGHINATAAGSYGGGTITKDATIQTAVIEILQSGGAAAVMDAGAAQTNIEPGTTVTLNSSASTGVTAGRTWSQTGGPAVTLSSTTATSPTFTAPPVLTDTTLTFKVTDNASGTFATTTVGVLRSSYRVKIGGVMTPVYTRFTLP